jgi:hypothetical protein
MAPRCRDACLAPVAGSNRAPRRAGRGTSSCGAVGYETVGPAPKTAQSQFNHDDATIKRLSAKQKPDCCRYDHYRRIRDTRMDPRPLMRCRAETARARPQHRRSGTPRLTPVPQRPSHLRRRPRTPIRRCRFQRVRRLRLPSGSSRGSSSCAGPDGAATSAIPSSRLSRRARRQRAMRQPDSSCSSTCRVLPISPGSVPESARLRATAPSSLARSPPRPALIPSIHRGTPSSRAGFMPCPRRPHTDTRVCHRTRDPAALMPTVRPLPCDARRWLNVSEIETTRPSARLPHASPGRPGRTPPGLHAADCAAVRRRQPPLQDD